MFYGAAEFSRDTDFAILADAAKPQPACAKRLECVELAPAFEPPLPSDSASKLDALETLRLAAQAILLKMRDSRVLHCNVRCVVRGRQRGTKWRRPAETPLRGHTTRARRVGDRHSGTGLPLIGVHAEVVQRALLCASAGRWDCCSGAGRKLSGRCADELVRKVVRRNLYRFHRT